MKTYLVLLAVCIPSIVSQVYAQRIDPSEYMVRDSVYSNGRVVPLGNGRIQFQRTKNETPVVYTASEVSEYGYSGKVFESVLVNGDHRFLKRIVTGRVKLYQDKKSYFLGIDSGLQAFNRRDFRFVIGKSIPCADQDTSLSRIDYAKTALIHYVNEYNFGRCNPDASPHRKLIGYVGYNFLKFTGRVNSSTKLTDQVAAPTLGFIYDLPVYRPSSLYLAWELNWSYANPLLYAKSGSNSVFVGLNMHAVNSLVDAKWRLSEKRSKAYCKVGALISFVNITSSTGYVETRVNGPVINTSREELEKQTHVLFGFNTGIGMEIPYKSRKNFHVELRYQKVFNGDFGPFSMNYSGLSVLAGFNI